MNRVAQISKHVLPQVSLQPLVASPTAVLDAHALKKHSGGAAHDYNPEWKPEGFEGGIDTNTLPWCAIPEMPGCSVKPIRASRETGQFTLVVKVPKGTVLPLFVHLGQADTLMLAGKLVYPTGPASGSVGPGVWGYMPAGSKMEGVKAEETAEFLWTLYGPIAFLGADKKSVQSLFTSTSARNLADAHGVPLLPNTLQEAMGDAPPKFQGKAEPLQMANEAHRKQLSHGDVPVIDKLTNPHFVDTNALPWIVNPEAPDIALKIMRISAETGTTSMIVRQNGAAPPHFHLGPADFFILSGRIGYRAGPPTGFGPGTYMLEPAGARHESTQPIEKDLIYTANVWGPIAFDDGVGTPVTMVLSWMQYLESAKAFNSPLMASSFEGDAGTWLAQTP